MSEPKDPSKCPNARRVEVLTKALAVLLLDEDLGRRIAYFDLKASEQAHLAMVEAHGEDWKTKISKGEWR